MNVAFSNYSSFPRRRESNFCQGEEFKLDSRLRGNDGIGG